MIAVIDYGAGNIFSVKNALDHLGYKNILTKSETDIRNADAIILPGVGAFPWAMKMLSDSGLVDTIKTEATKKPFLGICLGMQLLFDKGFEFEECNGLGLTANTDIRFRHLCQTVKPFLAHSSTRKKAERPV